MSNLAVDIIPVATASQTDAQLENQGYTYNQAGFTYDQAGIMYGGIQNSNQDIIPIVSLAGVVTPEIFGYSDIYTNQLPNHQRTVGPGWFMYVAQV